MQKRLFDNKLLSIIAVIILCLALAIGLVSCGADKGKKGRDKKKVEATKEKIESGKSSDSSKADNKGESEASGSDDSSSKELEAEKAKEKKKEKAKEKERAKEEKSKKDISDSSHSSSSHSKRKWVPAVYKTVTHPAVTRQQKFIDYYTCQCGATFKINAEWQAHRPKP